MSTWMNGDMWESARRVATTGGRKSQNQRRVVKYGESVMRTQECDKIFKFGATR